MSKIGGHSPLQAGPSQAGPSQAGKTPWSDQAGSEVREIRRAITSQISDEKVGRDVAPMMSELLARLDSFVTGEENVELGPPKLPGMADPPSLHEASAALGRAGTKVRQLAQGAADPQSRASLSNMVQVLDEHLAMRQEVLMRAETF
jgi:hypothetical protein